MSFPAFDFSTLGLCRERLSMDFANTTPYHHTLDEDHLRTYADLLAWSVEVSLLEAEAAERLYAQSLEQPGDAATVLARAIALREATYRLLANTYHEEPLDTAALDTVNKEIVAAVPVLRLVPSESGVRWAWVYPRDQLDQMLGPVVWSLVELLDSPDARRVRVCEGHDCDWLFFDTSRNHSRRWCSMETCGNRAKARRHYARSKSE